MTGPIWSRLLAWSLAACSLSSPGRAGADERFTPVGDLPGAKFESIADGLSADGSTVVGRSETLLDSWSLDEAFRWTRDGGIEGLGVLDIGPDFPRSGALAASADGRIVVGYSSHADADNGYMAFRWTRETGMEGLGDLGLGYVQSLAHDVSDDGSVIVGFGYNVSSQEAVRWTASGIEGLGYLPELPFFAARSDAASVSRDGSTVAGTNRSMAGHVYQAFRWTRAEGMVSIGDLFGGGVFSTAHAVSADGSTIVGVSESPRRRVAFRWTAQEGMSDLGDGPGSVIESAATAVSSDGAMVFGNRRRGALPIEAYVWDAVSGMRNLRTLLVEVYRIDLTGWQLQFVAGVSDDGRTLAGTGINPDGKTEAWHLTRFLRARSDIRPGVEPNRIALTATTLVSVAILTGDTFDAAGVDPATLRFGPARVAPVDPAATQLRDVDGDGRIDLISRFRVAESGIALGDTSACIVADTLEGLPFEACDRIQTVDGCGQGFALVGLLPLAQWGTTRLRSPRVRRRGGC